MKKSILLKNRDNIEVALSCVFLLFLWEIISLKIDNEIYLPTIKSVLIFLYELILTKKFYLDVVFSLTRGFISFIIASFVAIIFGTISFINKSFRNFIKPINSLTTAIPTMVIIILALIWFSKEKATYIVGFLIVFPILYDEVLDSLVNIDREIIEMLNLYKVNIFQRIRKIYLPSIKQRFFAVIVSTYSLVFKVVIAGEVYSQPKYGMGARIQVEKMNFNTVGIFAWIVVIVIISTLLSKVSEVKNWKK